MSRIRRFKVRLLVYVSYCNIDACVLGASGSINMNFYLSTELSV